MNLKNLLIVDDSSINIDILSELLSSSYELFIAIDAKSALDAATNNKIDLIILDIVMPEIDGYEICEMLKSKDDTKDIPVIFITGKTDEDSIEKAYEVGGIDYITKPFKNRELMMRVKTQLKLQDLLANLERLASRDTMTNIYNRRKLFELGIKKFNQADSNLCAIIIDIDKFKTINDTFGHATGDDVIKMIVKAIEKSIREDFIFARLGGDELAIVASDVTPKEIQTILESIRKTIKDNTVKLDSGKDVIATISSGVAFYKDGIKNLDALFSEADLALYDAKGEGRDRAKFR